MTHYEVCIVHLGHGSKVGVLRHKRSQDKGARLPTIQIYGKDLLYHTTNSKSKWNNRVHNVGLVDHALVVHASWGYVVPPSFPMRRYPRLLVASYVFWNKTKSLFICLKIIYIMYMIFILFYFLVVLARLIF